MKKGFILIIFSCCSLLSISAQKEGDINSKVEALGIFSGGDNAPFWLTNNKYGIGSVDKNKQYLRASSFLDKKINSAWSYKAGLDIIGANGFESHFFLQQAFFDLSFKKVALSIGMKERAVQFKNMQLFSGAMTLSNNARPIPQVEFSTPQFITLPFTNEWIMVKGSISYGAFTDDDFKIKNAGNALYAKNVLYHRKYGFLKIEKNKPWNIILGLEMDTQFRGDFFQYGNEFYSPKKIIDFFKVLIPMAGGSESSGADQVNIFGNVYGSTHYIFNYNFDKYSVKAYHEHFFEDHSGLFFENTPDGVYGIELNLKKKAPVSSILFEYIHTKNQTAPFLWDETSEIPIQVSGGDNYYNHFDYISLSNYGFTMGSPLLTSPIYNKGSSLMVKNSRIAAFHFGIGGSFSPEIDYRLLLTHSKSWGTSYMPTRNVKKQLSSMIECSYTPHKLEGWKFVGAVAFDKSSMVGDNFGVQLKLSKAFNTKF